MSANDTTLSAVALAISLVALITTLGQLLQQYFATADGFRRCQKSVMGEYARKTHRRWRWREFRFETLYTIPEIVMVGDGAPSRPGQVMLTGSGLTRDKTLIPSDVGGDTVHILKNSGPWDFRFVNGQDQQAHTWVIKTSKPKAVDQGELACWVPLLHWIHESTMAALKETQPQVDSVHFPPSNMRIPAIVFREKSWDFQPPDVVRPLAKSTLSDVAVIARRMGMKWKEFRPSDGILRAEGHSHVITSTVVRSLGIVLQYSFTGQVQRLKEAESRLKRATPGSLVAEQDEIYIPSAGADRLGCGVIRTYPSLGLPDYTVSTQNEIVTALSCLDQSGKSSASLSKILKETPDFHFRVADLVAFTSGFLRKYNSTLVQVPAPSDNVHGVTTSCVGRHAFRKCLEDYVSLQKENIRPATLRILDIHHDLSNRYAAWDNLDDSTQQDEQWVITRDPEYLDSIYEASFTLTDQLADWNREGVIKYPQLLASHIRVAVFREGGETCTTNNWAVNYVTDMEGYFSVLPKIVEEMKAKGVSDEGLVVDAWLTMMLRGLCWGASHFFVRGERVPIQYFGSQLPVYIG